MTSTESFEQNTFDVDSINFFDKLLLTEYSSTQDTISDFTQYAAYFSPMIFLVNTEFMDLLGIGFLYFETTLFAIGTKDLIKGLFPKARPYMYYDSTPLELKEDIDRYQSFPSGHTTMAFAGAGFTSFVFSKLYPDSDLLYPVIIVSYSLALSTAILRVSSGTHFLSDVLTGAVLGSLSGYLIPLIHLQNKKNQSIQITATPRMIGFSIKF